MQGLRNNNKTTTARTAARYLWGSGPAKGTVQGAARAALVAAPLPGAADLSKNDFNGE